jgi:hypothetical protein
MDTADRIHNMPVPERFLPLINKTLAEAYAAEAKEAAASKGAPPNEGSEWVWTEEEVARAYRESTPAQRTAFDYLADNYEREVESTELARVVYPNDNDVDARNKLYGVLGAFGSRSHKYGKQKWFFAADRERNPDGSAGRMVYMLPAEQAAWLRKASASSHGALPLSISSPGRLSRDFPVRNFREPDKAEVRE